RGALREKRTGHPIRETVALGNSAMQLEVRHLRYFLAVAEELNFSRAAEHLHIAQPALSAQIRVLEKQIGLDLFVRTTRKVELTLAGELLLADAREIVELSD